MRSGLVRVEGGELFYEITGSGPAVVLVHGFSFDLRMWDDQIPPLAHGHTVVRYDLRGFGRSSVPSGPFSHHEDLATLAAALDLERFDLVGLSLGGGVAVDFAISHPARVGRLVAADSTLSGFGWPRTRALNAAIGETGRREGIEAARAAWLASHLFSTARARPAVAERLRQLVAGYSGWHWVHETPVRPLAPPAIGRLAEVRAPTLVLVGERDDGDFQEISDRLAAGIAGAHKRVLPGVGHMANLEDPTLFNQALVTFLDAGRDP